MDAAEDRGDRPSHAPGSGLGYSGFIVATLFVGVVVLPFNYVSILFLRRLVANGWHFDFSATRAIRATAISFLLPSKSFFPRSGSMTQGGGALGDHLFPIFSASSLLLRD
ncbi:hypothetical protein CEXT_4801 [Caerostris extrusa]|uniref:Uncharacterized protein n=1 Tax=Caerostris extrusa TaxID=172846 RepID=A0AAV4N1W8_CAEEX|nr:hypothetical protein CEXT_4801 [Caerostris extrusa]